MSEECTSVNCVQTDPGNNSENDFKAWGDEDLDLFHLSSQYHKDITELLY